VTVTAPLESTAKRSSESTFSAITLEAAAVRVKPGRIIRYEYDTCFHVYDATTPSAAAARTCEASHTHTSQHRTVSPIRIIAVLHSIHV